MNYLKKYKFLILIIIISGLCLIPLLNLNKSQNEIESFEEPLISNEEVIDEKILYKLDIKGAVKNPGVYEVLQNSRVIDVINMAGGLLNNANTSTINLSKIVTDSMVIRVYTNEEIDNLSKENIKIEYVEVEKECICPKLENDACLEKDETNDLVNINTATLDELLAIPKIGESKAQEIIKYREENNGFKSIEEIKNINGIKDATYEAIKDYITV